MKPQQNVRLVIESLQVQKLDESLFLEKNKDNKDMCTPQPIVYKYDKRELKKMIQAGKEIEGVKLVTNKQYLHYLKFTNYS